MAHPYILACDVVSWRLVRVLRDGALPAGCFKVVRVRSRPIGPFANPYDAHGHLLPAYQAIARCLRPPRTAEPDRS